LVTKKKASDDHPLGGFAAHDHCCLVRTGTFKDGHCKIALPQADGTWICLSGTSYQRRHSFTDKLADLLFAWEKAPGLRVSAPVELKGGGVDVSHVQQQLQNGANLIADMMGDIKQVRFLPVLVHQTITEPERRTLRSHPVVFRGRKYEITSLKSGGTVASLQW
jgi:hypothetical protein